MTAPTTPPDPNNPGAQPAPGGYAPPAAPAPPASPPGGWQQPPPQAPAAAPAWPQQAPPAPGYGTPPPAPGYGTPPAPGYETPPAPGYETPPAPGYETPPAPGYGTPPPAGYGAPAPGWGGAPAGGRTSFDPKTVNPLDWGILGAGVFAFIFSTFSYYTYSFKGLGSASVSAWHGFFGWFAALVALVGAALVAIELFAPQIKLGIPTRLASTGAFALSTLCVLLALVVVPGNTAGISGFDKGHGIGYWLSFIVIVAGLVLSVLRLKATGGSLPWEKKKTV